MLLGYVRVSTNHQETGTRAAGALSDRLENQAVGKKGFKCGGLLAGHTPTWPPEWDRWVIKAERTAY